MDGFPEKSLLTAELAENAEIKTAISELFQRRHHEPSACLCGHADRHTTAPATKSHGIICKIALRRLACNLRRQVSQL